MLFQKRPQRAKCLTPVAHLGLSRAYFGQRAAKRRIEKNRVVAEAVAASRLVRDAAFDGGARLENRRVRTCERQRAHEPRRAGGCACRTQRVVDQLELFGIRGVDAAKARRLDSWRAAERVDLEARILSDRELPGRAGVVLGLGARVLVEGSPGLLRRGQIRPLVERDEVEVDAGENALDFLKLAAVRGCNEQPLHDRIFWRLGRGRRPEGRPPGVMGAGVSCGWLTAQRRENGPADWRGTAVKRRRSCCVVFAALLLPVLGAPRA